MRVFRAIAVVLAVVVSLHSVQLLTTADDDSDEFEFEGIVQSLPDNPGRIGDWMVGGRVVHVAASTLIREERRPVGVGVRVKVEGVLLADGSVEAVKIKVEDDDSEFEFKGRIETFPTSLIGDWMIGGRTVHVTPFTRIDRKDGPVTAGTMAEVEGFLRPDGSIDATKIEIEDDQREFEFKGIILSFPSGFIGDWMISGRTVHVTAETRIEQEDGPVAVGATVEVEGFLRPDGSVDARKIEVKTDGGRRKVNFKGTIESLPASGLIGDWQVSGETVHVSDSTRIKQKQGSVAVGVEVQVKGTELADGSIEAEKIQVRKSK